MKKSNQLIRWISAVGVIAAVIAVPVYLSHSQTTNGDAGGKVNVVAAENFWGNIAGQIGGRHINLTSIISDPNTDPHLYESDASDASKVASADIVITNGLGYDDFMNKLMVASPNKNRQVLTASEIIGISGTDSNPHLWYDLPRVPGVAAKIEQALTAKDPADKVQFEQNLTKFDNSLTPLGDVIAQVKARYGGTPVAYTEPVSGYLLQDAGLTVKTPHTFATSIEDGNEPSPADTLTMEKLMTSRAVKVLLYNSQATSPVTLHIRELAVQNGIPVIGVSETLPAGEKTYQSWQLDQAKALLNALGN